MSANYVAPRASIEKPDALRELLVSKLKLTWSSKKDPVKNSTSAAVTGERVYTSGVMESKSHLMDMTSEHCALALAVSCKDAHVEHVVTVVDRGFVLNPLNVKVMVDHVRRTGTPMAYSVYDMNGKVLFAVNDVMTLGYDDEPIALEKIQGWTFRENRSEVTEGDVEKQLYDAAVKGMETHFSGNTKTTYGGSVLSGGKIYFGGVYSGFEHRLGPHAEHVALLCALMDGNRSVDAVAVVSSKFVDEPVQMCGCCRQLFSEIVIKTSQNIDVHCFNLDGSKVFKTTIKDYLPGVWDSSARSKPL